MSQKSTRRARRQTNDDEVQSAASLKAPKPNGTETVPEGTPEVEVTPKQEEILPVTEEVTLPVTEEATTNDAKVEQNGTDKDIEVDNCRVTRSRSQTPQIKTSPEKAQEDVNVTETEMDPLIISDEPDPELVFEEGSDMESGKSSPVLNRCKTRRSVTRNIPTPKTPKCVDEDNVTPSPTDDVDSDNKDNDLNVTFESCADDVSTKAEAGGDSTRLDYMDKDFSSLENNSFLQGAKNKSFGETLRHLSTRRTIRPISDDYRKRLLRTNLDKNDLSSSYPSRNSVERISSVGIKRKNCGNGDDEYAKRFKSDSPGFFSKFTSPLNSIRNTFRSDIPSSTPKLTGYKDEHFLLEDDGINSKMCEVNDGERRWCSIM